MAAGSLTAAAERLGLSQPTVGRQIHALERDVGAPLFERTSQGLALTAAGAELRPVVEEMRRSAEAATRLVGTGGAYRGTVRISCGHWMARFLAENLLELSDGISDTRIVLVNTYGFSNVPRREVEIAIRNRRPERGRMVVRRLPDFTYAVYAHEDLLVRLPAAQTDSRFTECPWAGFDEEHGHLPTARWLAERRKALPEFQFSQSINILDAVKSGAALGILPCFVGDGEAHLRRIDAPFQPLSDGGWLVVNEDLRRAPHVRAVVDRVVALFAARRDSLDRRD